MNLTTAQAVFLGSKALGLSVFGRLMAAHPSVAWTVLHPDDSADPRNCLDAFRVLTAARGLTFHVVRSQADARALVAGLSPRIGFVCGWYWLFTAADIDAFPDGLWGIHNSLLPKFRGGAPLVWSIIAGEKEVGSTVFRISPGMDDGEVLMQVRVALGPEDDVGDALARIEAGLVEGIAGKWRALLDGEAGLAAQDEAQATWCGQRTDGDGGVDWSRPAAVLHNFIRAQAPPYPCAWTWLGEERLRILKARPFKGVHFGTPGQVLRRMGGSVLIACGGETALELLSLRRDGGGPEAPAGIIRSVRDRLTPAPRPPQAST